MLNICCFIQHNEQYKLTMPQPITSLTKLVLFGALICLPASAIWANDKTPDETGLDLAVKGLRFDQIEAALPTMPAGPERDYFAGVLANAENHVAESIQLLTAVLPGLRQSRPDRTAIALRTLADDYTKSFRYGEAAQTDTDLLEHFSSQLTPEQLKGTKNDSGIMQILG